MKTDKRPEKSDAGDDGPPSRREAQQPIGPVGGVDTWPSGEDEHDPLREEEAERARRAVEPSRPRE